MDCANKDCSMRKMCNKNEFNKSKCKSFQEVELLPALSCYYNRFKAFMEQDPDITTELDYNMQLITVTIRNPLKAAAWNIILPGRVETETLDFNFMIVCDGDEIDEDVVKTAFTGNNMFSRFEHIVIPEAGIDRNYAYFKPDVVQFENDNLASPDALETRTPEDLAKELFNIPLLNYCTERKEK